MTDKYATGACHVHVRTPGARLAGFLKGTTIPYYTQNMKALGIAISDFPIVRLWKLMTPGVGSFFDPRGGPHNNAAH